MPLTLAEASRIAEMERKFMHTPNYPTARVSVVSDIRNRWRVEMFDKSGMMICSIDEKAA